MHFLNEAKSMSVRLCMVLNVGVLLASCASLRTELPSSTRPAAVCIYNMLKSNPAILDVNVFVLSYGPVVSYTFKDASGKLATIDLSINKPGATGRWSYSGDFMTRGNPLLDMLKEIGSKCHADGGYNDQVIITGPNSDPHRWRVDMSQYANPNTPGNEEGR